MDGVVRKRSGPSGGCCVEILLVAFVLPLLFLHHSKKIITSLSVSLTL